MAPLSFEWDDTKAKANQRKHGLSFTDAIGVFFDPHRIERTDDRLDYGEERLQVIGQVDRQVLFVVYTERGTTYRLISARRATKDEQEEYYARYR